MKKALHSFTIVAIVCFGVILTNGCNKKNKTSGCKDDDATNYDKEAYNSSGDCHYVGYVTYWWKQPFVDSCASRGVSSVEVFYGNVLQRSIPVATLFWTEAPSCGKAENKYTIMTDLGSSKKTVLDVVRSYTIGTTVYSNLVHKVTVNADTCKNYEVKW